MVKEDVTAWDSILSTAGGLLELKKTAYALLIWQFKENGKPAIKQESELPLNDVYIHQKGVYQALAPTNSKAYMQVEKKTGVYTRAITACPLPWQE
eukprot:3988311-Ditylum_brightwellii.AAC.1